jgi:rubrerythrin
MTGKKDTAMKMLGAALEMEARGREFYEQAIGKCGNRLGRDIFAKLRDDEIVHQDRIRAIYRSLEGGTPWSEDWKKMKAGAAGLGSLFRDLAKKEGKNIRADTGDIEALEVGITLESRSVEFYQDHLEAAGDPLEREFTAQMVAEEKSHFDLLVDMKYYFSDPAGWFEEKEKIHVDGA